MSPNSTDTPTKNRDNFLRSGPFLMSNSGNGSHGQAASYAFGFVKKYLFFQKLQPKTFCGQKNSTRFLKKYFQKTFQKIQNLGFSKFRNFRFSLTFRKIHIFI